MSSPGRPEEAGRTLFVGNLESRVREEILYELFLQVEGGPPGAGRGRRVAASAGPGRARCPRDRAGARRGPGLWLSAPPGRHGSLPRSGEALAGRGRALRPGGGQAPSPRLARSRPPLRLGAAPLPPPRFVSCRLPRFWCGRGAPRWRGSYIM